MMYNQKLACSVKINNKILREKIQDGNSFVYIPFGSEYSLILKNLAGKNAVVHIEIDGKDITESNRRSGIYLTAGRTAEIEGFINNNFIAERKFKFIQKTQEISDFRGDKIDDGMIRVTWQFEKAKPITEEIVNNVIYKYTYPRWINCVCCRRWHYDNEPCRQKYWCYECRDYHFVGETCPNHWNQKNPWVSNGTLIGSGTSSNSSGSHRGYSASLGNADVQAKSVINSEDRTIGFAAAAEGVSCYNMMKSDEVNAYEGITVEGSKSGQAFGRAYAQDLEENVHSMVIVLRGYIGEKVKVVHPAYVRDKKQCPSCGRKYKGNMEFCPRDGTALK